MQNNVIWKIKKSGLCGRSGSDFPTGLKWALVKKAKGKTKYIICNASEGEPQVKKDYYILKKYPDEVINGIKIALKTLSAKRAYIYINKKYYEELGKTLKKLTKGLPIELFIKQAGYLRGEETTLLNVIEGKTPLPRIKPPFPTEKGLFEKPTLINNVETLYFVSKIIKKEYCKTKFYSITGDVKNKGVFELPENLTIKKILIQTNNEPKFDFFIQSGGGACGEILLANELAQPVKGLGSIIIYNKKKTDITKLMKKWTKFFNKENCDKCVPCREGLYRVEEILNQGILSSENKKILDELFSVMEQTSLCPLGKIAPTPFKSAIKKLL